MRKERIRVHAAEGNIGHAGVCQGLFHPVKQTGTLDAAAAVQDQHLRRAVALHDIADPPFFVSAKKDLCRRIIGKIIHSHPSISDSAL